VALTAVQTGWPVSQLSVPTRHGDALGVHSASAWHAAQLPAGEQTPPVHAVPGSWLPTRRQTAVPDEQSNA
jgi:hypothetical protein